MSHGCQCCVSDEVRCSVGVEPGGVLDYQMVDGLCVSSSDRKICLDMQSVQYWRCDRGVAMDRRCSRPSHSAQLRSKHVSEGWSVLGGSLYLTGVWSTWGIHGLPRMIFDPGGMGCYSLRFCTSVMSSLLQRWIVCAMICKHDYLPWV